uniref:Uncharacterized protein n=1 Tax=Vombatus ursinus TaxID=29139 RepID=A0A4X2K5Y4_VOMUR
MGVPWGGWPPSLAQGKLHSGGYGGLPTQVLSCTHVVAGINGLKVLQREDAPGQPRGAPEAPADQSPHVLDRHGPFILFHKTGCTWVPETDVRCGSPGEQRLVRVPSTLPIPKALHC